jgi:hypothetical protein
LSWVSCSQRLALYRLYPKTALTALCTQTGIEPLPNFNRALNDTGGIDGRKALRVALGSPWRTAKLLVANRRAMQELSKALEIILKADCFK